MRIFLLVLHLLLTLVMIGVILIQRGEDANAGASSGGVPGARSGKNLLTRLTAVLASIFFANCAGMAILVRKESKLIVMTASKSDANNGGNSGEAAPGKELAPQPVSVHSDNAQNAVKVSSDKQGRIPGEKSMAQSASVLKLDPPKKIDSSNKSYVHKK